MIYLATRPTFPCLPFCPQHWWFQSQWSCALCGCFVPGFSDSMSFPTHLPRVESSADTEQRMALLSGNAKPGVKISGDGIFCDKPMWVAIQGVLWMQQKDNSQEHGSCWRTTCPCILGSVGLSYNGNSSLPVSWRVYQVQLLVWFMFPNEPYLCLVQACASAPFSGTSLASFHAWFIAPVVQSQTCMLSWQGGHCSRAMLTWSIPAFKILSHEMLCFFVFLGFFYIALFPDYQPYRQMCLTFLQHWGSKWKKLGLEYLFSWTLSWCFQRLSGTGWVTLLALIFGQERGCSVAFHTLGLSQGRMIRCQKLYTQTEPSVPSACLSGCVWGP